MIIVLVGCATTAPVPPPHLAQLMEAEPMRDVWPSMSVAPRSLYPIVPQVTNQPNRESAYTAYQPGGSNSSTNCF